MKVEILGERKTGTNYVKEMLKRHFAGYDLIIQGWKHRLIDSNKMDKDVLYIICIKDPYSWLQSLYDKPYHMLSSKQKGFSKFLTSQAKDFTDKGIPRKYPNPIKMWNCKCGRYKDFIESDFNTFLIRHEDILVNYRSVFMRLHKQKYIGLIKRLTTIKNHVDDMGVNKYPFNTNKYGVILNADRQFISEQLNNNLLKFYNYQ